MVCVFLTEMTRGGAMPMLEKTLAFNEARQKVLATNIANITTPGYRAKQLDVAGFQAALRDASTRRQQNGGPLQMESTSEFRQGKDGFLQVTPSEEPVDNILFKDGANASIEQQMSRLAETAMTHQISTELLKGYFDGLQKAIRGRAL